MAAVAQVESGRVSLTELRARAETLMPDEDARAARGLPLYDDDGQQMGARFAALLGRLVFDAMPRNSGHLPLAEAILELAAAFGVDAVRRITEWKSHWGGFALDNAAQTGSLDAVELLIKFGARVNIREDGDDLYGYPLYAASNNGHGETCYALLMAGADPHCEGYGSGSALRAALRNKREGQSFRAFARAGVDLTAPQKDGWVALTDVMQDDMLRGIFEEYSGTMTKSAAKR
jgi:Ankyrin repeats (3 copies)